MFATASLALLTLCPSLPVLSVPQSPDEVLAHYRLRGEPATITRADVALEMAFHMRRRDRGREACEVLVDSILTRREAERLGLMPTAAEVQKFWRDLQDQLRAAGRRPEDFAAVRNTGEQQWLRDLSISMAQERLVRRELGLGERESVSGDMLKLWLSETRKKADVVTDPELLPAGTAARVDTDTVQLIDLGLLLLRTSEDDERDRFIRQVAYLDSIEALGADRSITVTPSDLDAAVEQRRQEAQNDPRFRGVKLENLLEAQGLSIAALRQLRVFRSQVLLDKLALVEFPDEALRQQLIEQREQVLDEVGPRRRIGVIFVRAQAEPNAIVTRDFAMAQKHLEAVRKRIAEDGFAATASIESEDGDSKQTGGDVGWHRRGDQDLPEPVLQAAFALQPAEVSQPIVGEHGAYLVTVLDREPMPEADELIRRLRILRGQELSERILREAEVEIVGQQKQPEKQR